MINIRKYVLIISGLIFLFSSCKIFEKNQKEDLPTIIYPSPPDTARIQFLTAINSSESISGKQSKFNKFIFGEEKPIQIVKPADLFLRFGKIYICDPGLKGLEIIDLENKTFNYFIPEGKGELKLPLGCYVDDGGYLYVADGNRKQVVIFDNNGKYVSGFGEIENFKPTDVFVSDDKIWVANIKDYSIYVYNRKDQKFLFKFPEIEEEEQGFLRQPGSLWVTNDKVYVSDYGDFNVKSFDYDGHYLQTIGSYGKSVGQFVRQKCIAADREENIYAVDVAFENVQIFNKKGELLMFFGGPYNGRGDMYLPFGITIDYDNLKYFEEYVDPEYTLKYLILVTNQYGPDKLTVYGRIEMKEK